MRSILAVLALTLAPLAAAAQADPDAIAPLREGDMKKLVVHPAPQDVADAEFSDIDGGSHRLSDFRGKVVLVNFWATWCAPCREEMPALDALQAELGGADFEVVTIATGRNAPQAIRRFFDETGVQNLPTYTDPDQALARQMAVLGLPISVVLNRDGQEIARLRGDADWASESAQAIFLALIGEGA